MVTSGTGIKFTHTFLKTEFEISAMRIPDQKVQLFVVPKSAEPMKFSGIITETAYREFTKYVKDAPMTIRLGLGTNTGELTAKFESLWKAV